MYLTLAQIILFFFLTILLHCNAIEKLISPSQTKENQKEISILLLLTAGISNLADSKISGTIRLSGGALIESGKVIFTLKQNNTTREQSRAESTESKIDGPGNFVVYLKNGDWIGNVLKGDGSELGKISFTLKSDATTSYLSNKSASNTLFVKYSATKLGTDSSVPTNSGSEDEPNPTE